MKSRTLAAPLRGLSARQPHSQPASSRPPADLSSGDALLGIGEMAREFGVSLRTLRFYEDRGLLQPRRQGSVRLYTSQDRTRLATILKGKELGFTLTEIRSMVEASDGAGAHLSLTREQIDEQIRHLSAQKVEIEAALDELHQQREALGKTTQAA